MQRENPLSEQLERMYFDFIRSAVELGRQAKVQESHCDFVGDKPEVVKDYIDSWQPLMDRLNSEFDVLKRQANSAHGLRL